MKIFFKIFILIIIILALFLLAKKYAPKVIVPARVPNNQADSQKVDMPSQNSPDISSPNPQAMSGFQPPLAKASNRVTKKSFGVYITPATSPIQPEKFSGYHTGTDFEIFPEELTIDVPVKAICSGKLLMKKSASGYGGVAVEVCILDGNPITVIYGHLKLSSIDAKINADLQVGDTLGILGADKSTETSGERKHLHLSLHKGSAINILGYVNSQSQLSSWIDACRYVCF